MTRGSGEAHFDTRFAEDTELIGHMKLRLWVEARRRRRHGRLRRDPEARHRGEIMPASPFFAIFDNGPVALGWLRA